MVAQEARRKARVEQVYRAAMAREKARHEVLLAMSLGTLKARQVDGDTFIGRVGSMQRGVRFSLEGLVYLRTRDLLGS